MLDHMYLQCTCCVGMVNTFKGSMPATGPLPCHAPPLATGPVTRKGVYTGCKANTRGVAINRLVCRTALHPCVQLHSCVSSQQI